METKAHHVIVGAFVLLMALGAVVFLIWAAKIGPDKEYDYYTIYFETAVTGLSRSGDVRYNGIFVGSVDSIRLSPDKPGQVRVDIKVNTGTPITTHSIATLSVAGLTGVSYVLISERDPDEVTGPRMMLATREGEDYPIIPARVTGLQGLFLTAPELLEEGIKLLAQGNKLFSDDNISLVHNILEDVETVTGGVADRTDDIQRAITALRSSMERIDKIAASAEGIAEEDLPTLMANLSEAAQNFRELSANLDAMVGENREAVSAFTSTALPEVSQMATEARRLISTLSRIAEQLEESPLDFVFPPQVPEIEAGK